MNEELSREYEIRDVDTAKSKVLKLLAEKYNYTWYSVHPINKERYYLILSNKENILIMFKRETFHNFGFQFKGFGMKGVGDTINCNELKTAIKNGVKTIYSTFPNEHIYYIDLNEFLEKSIKWINKEGKLVRSISIHDYKRLE